MRNKKVIIVFVVLILAALSIWLFTKFNGKHSTGQATQEISPVKGSIRVFISTTGSVLPKNRLELKPPVNGRIESILVKEGDLAKTGQILAWMSSTERAALLDAAEGQGEEALKYWKDTYKAIPLLAPINGQVIVATTQPGQTVTTAEAVLVLSDTLIVRAQVDETDIGKIKNNMSALITLDAYPETKIKAITDHIYYESQTVNNVTIYPVDLVVQTEGTAAAQFFRSGMNASIDFLIEEKNDILVIPVDAVHKNGESFVFVKKPDNKEPAKVRVELGITDDKDVEVISGLTEEDRVLTRSKKYSIPKTQAAGTNPFLPSRRR